jgi:hypothetical protein
MKQALLALAGLAFAAPAFANDSTAETAAGGLVLTQSDSIDMLSEDLYVSSDEIRVHYVFRNQSAEDVRTLVAFPMPIHDLAIERDGDVAFPSDFTTRVDGAEVPMQVERRASVDGRDITQLLEEAGVSLSSDVPAWDFGDLLDALPEEAQQRLIEADAVEVLEHRGARHLQPMWQVSENWYWQQLFPAGEDIVVEHSYHPGTGGSVDTGLIFDGFAESERGQAMIADYCIDADFLAGVERMRSSGRYLAIGERVLTYILTTGANWRAPIGDFRLVVDKGEPENLVSFCAEGVRKIAPTQFEARHRNWRPDRDLRVLILVPYADE